MSGRGTRAARQTPCRQRRGVFVERAAGRDAGAGGLEFQAGLGVVERWSPVAGMETENEGAAVLDDAGTARPASGTTSRRG